jgi:hypothetical protein
MARVSGEAKDVEEAVSGVGCLDGTVIMPLLKDTFDKEDPDGGGGDGTMPDAPANSDDLGSIPAALSAWLKLDLPLWTLPPPPPALAASFSKYSTWSWLIFVQALTRFCMFDYCPLSIAIKIMYSTIWQHTIQYPFFCRLPIN